MLGVWRQSSQAYQPQKKRIFLYVETVYLFDVNQMNSFRGKRFTMKVPIFIRIVINKQFTPSIQTGHRGNTYC
jgi:hypothetical protein